MAIEQSWSPRSTSQSGCPDWSDDSMEDEQAYFEALGGLLSDDSPALLSYEEADDRVSG